MARENSARIRWDLVPTLGSKQVSVDHILCERVNMPETEHVTVVSSWELNTIFIYWISRVPKKMITDQLAYLVERTLEAARECARECRRVKLPTIKGRKWKK